jgi:hypothetical protein
MEETTPPSHPDHPSETQPNRRVLVADFSAPPGRVVFGCGVLASDTPVLLFPVYVCGCLICGVMFTVVSCL